MRARLFAASVVALLALAANAHAETFQIDPSGDLPAAIAALAPGDELVLAGGTYDINQLFVVSVSGTQAQPILIRAADGQVPVITRPDANRRRYTSFTPLLNAFVTVPRTRR